MLPQNGLFWPVFSSCCPSKVCFDLCSVFCCPSTVCFDLCSVFYYPSAVCFDLCSVSVAPVQSVLTYVQFSVAPLQSILTCVQFSIAPVWSVKNGLQLFTHRCLLQAEFSWVVGGSFSLVFQACWATLRLQGRATWPFLWCPPPPSPDTASHTVGTQNPPLLSASVASWLPCWQCGCSVIPCHIMLTASA